MAREAVKWFRSVTGFFWGFFDGRVFLFSNVVEFVCLGMGIPGRAVVGRTM